MSAVKRRWFSKNLLANSRYTSRISWQWRACSSRSVGTCSCWRTNTPPPSVPKNSASGSGERPAERGELSSGNGYVGSVLSMPAMHASGRAFGLEACAWAACAMTAA